MLQAQLWGFRELVMAASQAVPDCNVSQFATCNVQDKAQRSCRCI